MVLKTAKTAVRKTAMPKSAIQQILYMDVRRIGVGDVKPYPGNPRRGDIDAIAASLKKLGQYRPIVVQKSTNFVLAGNHTLLASRKLKWTHLMGGVIDVDDETAKQIVLADNKTPELGSYDYDDLKSMLASVNDIEGTGWTEEERELILNSSEDSVRDALAASDSLTDLSSLFNPDPEEPEEMAGDPNFGLDDDDDDDNEEGNETQRREKGALESASDETKGVLSLKDNPVFDGVGEMQIPRIRDDMLLDALPDNMLTWSGSATRDWPDEDVWWFYNFGIDSTSGMKDPSRMLLAFYAYDHYFDNWWYFPDRYIAKMLNTGIKMAVTPDFSMYEEEPRIVQLHQLFKARWLGRYFQEVGVKIIPDIVWPFNNMEVLEKYVLPGIPVGAPIIAIGAAAFNEELMAEGLAQAKACFRKVVSVLKPEMLFIYTNKNGREFVEGLKLPCKVHFQPGRMEKLSDQAKQRGKKKTL